MTRAASGRRPRGRVVVVGDAAAAAEPRLGRDVVRTANLFEALGEVTVATAAAPVIAVLVPADLARSGAAMVFHRVDPSVRVLLVVASGQPAPPTRDGFDGVLREPIDREQLEVLLLDDDDDREREPSAPTVEVVARSPAPSPPEPPPELEPPTERAPEPAPDVRLGDIDLVEAIMVDPAGLRDRALRLAIQQTGWDDLALLPAETTPALAAAPVRHGTHDFGLLVSSRTDAARLAPWAQWLARWMSLDESYRQLRTLAYHDELTGAGNRRFFDLFMKRSLRDAARHRRAVTVMVFDIDDFKRYNDDFGHEAGDEVLIETVRLLNSVIRSGDRVCRIGGDEFVVIFADPEGPREVGSRHPQSVEVIAGRFQSQITQMKFPKLGLDAPGTLSVSGGLATFPWDGTTAEDLLRHADRLALESKRMGKNVITLGPGGPEQPPPH